MKVNVEQRSARRFFAMCVLAIAGTIATAPCRCFADEPDEAPAQDVIKTRFIIDDADPESKVPSPQEALKSPMQMGYWVMLVSDRAEAASQRHDYASAAKYYRAIAKAAPDRAIGFTKACAAYEASGEWRHAVENCSTALGRNGATLDDYAHLVRLVLAKDGTPSSAEIGDADAAIAHLEAEFRKSQAPDADPAPTAEQLRSSRAFIEGLKCQIGTRMGDRKRLYACSRALASIAPGEPTTVAFEFALALVTHDFDQAESLIRGAQKAGVNQSGVALMQSRLEAEVERAPLLTRLLGSKRALALSAGALVLIVAALVLLMRRYFGTQTSAHSLRSHSSR